MNITGGSFGVTGKLRIEDGEILRISAAIDAAKQKQDIASVETSIAKEKKFGVLGFLLGAPILALFGWMILPVIGALVGLVLATFGSFYQKKTLVVHVAFKDGSKVTAEGWNYEIQKIVRMAA
jgi:hypothetical protein